MKWILSKKITRAAKASELGDFSFVLFVFRGEMYLSFYGRLTELTTGADREGKGGYQNIAVYWWIGCCSRMLSLDQLGSAIQHAGNCSHPDEKPNFHAAIFR